MYYDDDIVYIQGNAPEAKLCRVADTFAQRRIVQGTSMNNAVADGAKFPRWRQII